MSSSRRPTTIRAGQVFWWAVAASCGVAAVVVGSYTVYLVRDVLVRVLIALFVAMSLDPAVRWLTGRGVRRPVAVTGIVILALGLVAGFVWSVVPPLVHQASNLVDDFPTYARSLSERSATYRELADRYGLTEKITSFLAELPGKIGPDALGMAQRFFGAVFNVLLIVVLAIYFMADLPRIRRGIVWLAPSDRRAQAARAVTVVVDKVGAYMAGNLIISLFAGVSTYLCLTLVNVPFALPLAFFVALTDLIPLVGATIGAAGCVVVSVFTVDLWPQSAVVLLFFVVYQQVENYLIAPRVLRNTVDLSSIAVLLSALLGGTLLGTVGALMAIPFAAAGKALIATAEPETPVRSESDGDLGAGPGRAEDGDRAAQGPPEGV